MGIRAALAVTLGSLAVAAMAALAFFLVSDIRVSALSGAIDGALCINSANATVAPTFNSEIAEANERMHTGMAIASSGDPDRDFAQMMIAHHQGAIDMARIELKYGRDKTLRRLAQSIIVEQNQEIAYMRSLLARPLQGDAVADSTISK